MYILDTHVVSELMKATADVSVTACVAALPRECIFTTAIISAEIFAGIARLPVGRRRDGLQAAAGVMFGKTSEGRVLPFDEAAFRIFASVTAARRAMGRPIEDPDAQKAAVALVARYTLLTRNVTDFEHCGLLVVDPWASTVP